MSDLSTRLRVNGLRGGPHGELLVEAADALLELEQQLEDADTKIAERTAECDIYLRERNQARKQLVEAVRWMEHAYCPDQHQHGHNELWQCEFCDVRTKLEAAAQEENQNEQNS